MRFLNWAALASLTILGVAARSSVAGADPVEVDSTGVLVHELAPLTHVLAGVSEERWLHQTDGRLILWQPSAGEHPDSVYFYPAKPRWQALPYWGSSTGWASCSGMVYGVWRSWEDETGYIALPRALAARLAVAFVYLDESGNWDGSYDWVIRQSHQEP